MLLRGWVPGAIVSLFGASIAQNVITDDSFFYGQSPPVYPSPNITGLGNWAAAHRRAAALVAKMTLEEKVGLTAGVASNTSAVGTVGSIERLGFPGFAVTDAENGVRSVEFASSWPSGLHVTASWNRDLANDRAKGIGGEYRKKGVNMVLGPVIGPMGRTVSSGRIWEGFSIDPYLSGAIAYETISGIQSRGVGTSTKHYIGNEQETNRKPNGSMASVSSNIDDKTMHELYLWPFYDAVRAGTTSIMCSYQRVNNSYGCQNSKTLNGLLKTELGFQAIHGGVASALAGLDLAMPNDGGFWGQNLVDAVNNGSVPEYRVDDMATRILASWYQMHQDEGFPSPGVGMPADMSTPHASIDARDPAYKKVLYQGAVEGHVLLKNDGVLPLKKPKMLSVFGFSARAPDSNTINGIWGLGYAAYDLNGVTESLPENQYRPIAINGTLFSGGGSGSTSQSLVSSPMDALVQQCWDDDTAMFWDFLTDAPAVNANSDACLVITNLYGSEGFDRPALESNYTNTLIENVAAKCNNTIAIVHNAGPAVVGSWADHPNVKAVIFAHLPGQYSGRALVDLLYGREDFSGKLPYTVAKQASDYGSLLNPDLASGEYALFPQANFSEGVLVDYRRFDALGISPRYEFGYGMSYTSFAYKNLRISKNSGSANVSVYPAGKVQAGGPTDLWNPIVVVSADIRNTGSRDGAEVAQLYITMPGNGTAKAVKQLRGFDKQTIGPGKGATLKFQLLRRDLSIWDTMAQKWKLQRGEYKVMVGSSSSNLPLTGTFVI